MTGIFEMFAELDGYVRYADMIGRPPQSLEHGYRAYVTYGCRCETCRAANAEYHRDYDRRRRFNDPVYRETRRRAGRESMRRARKLEHASRPQPPTLRRCGLCRCFGHNARSCESQRAAAA